MLIKTYLEWKYREILAEERMFVLCALGNEWGKFKCMLLYKYTQVFLKKTKSNSSKTLKLFSTVVEKNTAETLH